MEIINNKLIINGEIEVELPELSYNTTLDVYEVPTSYRSNGYFVSIPNESGVAEFPACSQHNVNYKGSIFYPASENSKRGQALVKAIEMINQWRDVAESESIIFKFDGHRWDGGLIVRQRLQPVVALPALPENFFWTDADNIDRPMDIEKLKLLNSAHEMALVEAGFNIHVRQRQMKQQIQNMTLEELLSFTPS